MEQKFIEVRGAREHNLKNVDMDIPRDSLVVITGLSGSGKSSLAFDTIYAEGQRRYVESLSAYARQFLDMMGKPDVDHITGLSPAISIEQKTTSKNPRSTVGTVTEDDLKDRLVLSSEGFISIYTVIDPATGKIIAGPEFHARAFAPDDRVFEPLVPQVRKALEDALDDGVRDTYRLSQAVRRVVGRWAGTKQRRRPMIVPVVTFAN